MTNTRIERRQTPRLPCYAGAVLRRTAWVRPASAQLLDVSVQGCRVVTGEWLRPGDTVLDLSADSGETPM